MLGVKYLPSKGGTSRVAEDLIEALGDRYDVTLYCYRGPRARGHLPRVRVVQFSRLPLGSLGVFAYYLACCIHLMVWERPDVVHVHKTDAAVFLPILTLRFPCVATSHEAPYRRDKWSFIGRLYFRLAERIFVRSRASLTCVSRPLTDTYRSRYGREVAFIPNGLGRSLERNGPAAAELLAELGVCDGYLLFAARRIMSTKGCHTFLEALRFADHRGPVLIVGDGGQVPAYTERLRLLAKGLDVHFVRPVARDILMELVARAEAFVFPSETEGMSMMLLEVARVGTPMICSRIPENTAVFAEDEVLYFDSGNADDLAARLAWASKQPKEMRRRVERARQRVDREHTMESIAERYAELYERAGALGGDSRAT